MKITKDTREKIYLFLSILFIYSIILVHCLDSDMFFIVSSGNDILNGEFYYNPHTQLPLVNQQWLYSVILALIDNNFGFIGDTVFVLVQDTILFWLTYKLLYKKTNDKYMSLISPIILIILTSCYMINVRPQIITVILLLAEYMILDKYTETNNWKHLLKLIPILLLFANVHNSIFLYSGIILIPFLIRNHKIDWKIVTTGIIMPLFTLCTPYGLDGALFIFRVFIYNNGWTKNISELQPIPMFSMLGAVFVVVLISMLVLIYFKKSNKYINFYSTLTLILLVTAARHFILMYIPLVLITVVAIQNKPKVKIIPNYMSLVLLFTCSIICFSTYAMYNESSLFEIKNEIELIEKLDEANIPKDSKIFNNINIGAYLEYYEYNAFIDLRPELYTKPYNNDRLAQYTSVNTDNIVINVDNVKNIDNFDYVILYNNDPLVLMIDNKYSKIIETDKFYVYKVS